MSVKRFGGAVVIVQTICTFADAPSLEFAIPMTVALANGGTSTATATLISM